MGSRNPSRSALPGGTSTMDVLMGEPPGVEINREVSIEHLDGKIACCDCTDILPAFITDQRVSD